MAMAVEPQVRILPGPFTRADLENTPEDGRRYEIIDGTMLVSAAPRVIHQIAAFELAVRLRAAQPFGYLVLPGPVAVGLADDTEIQPDIVVGHTGDFTERDLTRPQLAVEILSPSTRRFDLRLKRARCERAGVPSYWAVDPSEPSLTVWELAEGGTYRLTARVSGTEAYRAVLPFPVTIVPADLVG